ncbi:MAG: MoaD/ThiS family protein [Candidatus Bipolaricaulota bacterium]|nr:MoaD/ThiS family protein [Candidatus Bipolaricaulota bacterium]
MNVEVRLYAGLRAESVRSPGDVFSVPLTEGATLSDLFSHLGIQPDLVHLAIVNGRILHDRAARLADGDRVALFPPVGGG